MLSLVCFIYFTSFFLPYRQLHDSPVGQCCCCSKNDIRRGLISYTKADICGVEFSAGQSVRGNRCGRCGSVFTCVIDGQSVYGNALKFFSHACDNNNGLYAHVQWFNMPDYPFEGTPLVVRIQDNSQTLDTSVVSIFDIDPSRVILERSDEELCYYMCRIEGFDTIKSCE